MREALIGVSIKLWLLKSLRLRNCKIFYRGSVISSVEILVEDGKITRLTKLKINKPVDETIDLNGLLVIPGLIDVHVHLRGLNLAYKEDYDTGTLAAAFGGFSTVLDMPNTDPATENVETLKLKIEAAKPKIYVNLGFYSFIPEKLTEIHKLAAEGIFGFKVFMHRIMSGYKFDSLEDLRKPFEAIGRTGLPVLVHAEKRETYEAVKQENPDGGLEAFEDALSEGSENESVSGLIAMLRKIKPVKLHFCHVSCPASLKRIAEAKAEGLSVTCEVAPHHLLLSKGNYETLGIYGLVDPPLRSEACVEGLWAGVRRSMVDCIASDHAPHTLEEKSTGNVWNVKTGFPGLETLLPLMLDCVNRGWLSLSKLVKLTSQNPAKIFRIAGRGSIEIGYWADLTAVDLNGEFTIDPSKFKSKAKHSPFKGWGGRGVVKGVFVNGDPVVLNGELLGRPGIGKILKPGV